MARKLKSYSVLDLSGVANEGRRIRQQRMRRNAPMSGKEDSVLEQLGEWISQARNMDGQDLRDAGVFPPGPQIAPVAVERGRWNWLARQIEEAKVSMSGKIPDSDDTGAG